VVKAAAFFATALILLAPPGAGDLRADSGAQIQDARQVLSAIRHEINANLRTVRTQALKERSDFGTLQRLNRELEAARRDARTHKHNLGLVRERLARLQAAVDRLESEEAEDRAFLGADLVGLYKARTGQEPLLLFSAQNPAELQLRGRYLEVLALAAQNRVDSLGGDLGQLDSYRNEFNSRYNEFELRMRQDESDRRRKLRERAGTEAQLRAVRGRKARALEAVRELQGSEDRLQGMLDALRKEALLRQEEQRREERAQAEQIQAEENQAAQNQAAQNEPARSRPAQEEEGQAPPAEVPEAPAFRGRGLGHGLPWPVDGPVLSEYGKHLYPVFNIPVFNRGIEIGAALGSPVRVVAAGLVDYAGELEGFGHLVVVDHGQGMLSVYGYGSRLLVRKGQSVRRGDVLEDVGESQDLQRPSLYFEIRRGVKAQDPLRYLERR
jgi:septal ring factor EnvC (AmiA/AmiB activator)